MKFMCAIGAMFLLVVFLKADGRPEETAAALTDPTFKAFLVEFEKKSPRSSTATIPCGCRMPHTATM